MSAGPADRQARLAAGEVAAARQRTCRVQSPKSKVKRQTSNVKRPTSRLTLTVGRNVEMCSQDGCTTISSRRFSSRSAEPVCGTGVSPACISERSAGEAVNSRGITTQNFRGRFSEPRTPNPELRIPNSEFRIFFNLHLPVPGKRRLAIRRPLGKRVSTRSVGAWALAVDAAAIR